jgi:fatty-acyl-CoA synthase
MEAYLDAVSARADSPSQSWARALTYIAPLRTQPWASLPRLIDALAAEHGGRVALASEATAFTYCELAQRKSQIARWAMSRGLGAAKTVGLLLEGGPDYVAAWLGLSETGATVALLNTSLPGASLAQAITASDAQHIIVDQANEAALHAVLTELPWPVAISVHGGSSSRLGFPDLDCQAFNAAPLSDAERKPVPASATALLVFTSGTTGLPKAARISHYRVLEWSYWFAGMMNTGPADCLYDCLPPYHSTGGVAAIGGVLVRGGSVFLRPRFSARRFWDDVTDHRCTLFLYIGELCRYLVSQPAHPNETMHQLRLCCGNGLREDVWYQFQERFHIPRILEFYASTEGNVSLYNCDGKAGAIGRIPTFLRHRFSVALVACDPATSAIERNEDGSCRRCQTGEPGEALGLIATSGHAEPGAFEGYTDTSATERKILRDVFTPGDAWFRTGDLMRQDASGYFYFIDRLGDTFRWKGENVSTTQVADSLSRYAGVMEAVVYGVTVPGEEGRAGMAAMTIAPDFDIDRLADFLALQLPHYAWPQFVRICDSLATTATFKPVKTRLMQEGFDTNRITDPLYRLDQPGRRYRRYAVAFLA